MALGRPSMYSVAMGDGGVAYVIRLLSEEIETTMRKLWILECDDATGQVVVYQVLDRFTIPASVSLFRGGGDKVGDDGPLTTLN